MHPTIDSDNQQQTDVPSIKYILLSKVIILYYYMRVDSRTVRRPCIVVPVRCPTWSCVVRCGRALSDMFARRPPWSRVVCRGHASCIVHRRSWPVRRCLSVVAHHSSPIAPPWLSVIRRGWSWLVVAHHPSIVHHRRSSIHRPSSLLVRHRVIGRLTSSCAVHHHWSCIVGRRWSAAVERRPSASGPSTVDGQCGEGESSQRRGKWGMKLSSYQAIKLSRLVGPSAPGLSGRGSESESESESS
jgi:hypothetical protein